MSELQIRNSMTSIEVMNLSDVSYRLFHTGMISFVDTNFKYRAGILIKRVFLLFESLLY